MYTLRGDLTANRIGRLLRYADRNAMYHSIENRVPFLTIELAEFLLTLPEAYLLSPKGETKHVFRAAMRGLVPDVILDRKDKIGFQTPEKDWIKRHDAQVKKWLSALDRGDFMNREACLAEIEQLVNGEKQFNYQAWRFINFAGWVDVNQKKVV